MLSRGDREIGINRLMQGDNPAGMLRKRRRDERHRKHRDSRTNK
jgi:hypothetical protein